MEHTLLVESSRADVLKQASRDWPSWDLTPRQLCDLELLLNGGFAPLRGFLGQADYESVWRSMTLADGTFWPLPVVLDVPEEFAQTLCIAQTIALRDPEGVMLAALHVQDVWQPAHPTESQTHWYVGGPVEGLQLPEHYDFHQLRLTPVALRQEMARSGWQTALAVHVTHPIHRAQYEAIRQAMHTHHAPVVIHAILGPNAVTTLDPYTRMRCYQALLPHFPPDMVKLAILPLDSSPAGSREVLLRALIAKNYGCTHLLTETKLSDETYTIVSQRLAIPLPFQEPTETLSETELRTRLSRGAELPPEFTLPEVAAELHRAYPPRSRQGATIFFTGLSGAGKSTIAKILAVKLLEIGGRPVTLLDGDVVRKNLSSELGFSKAHRDLNIRRIGFVASEITKNGGIAICAPIAPYDHIRKEVRTLITPYGGFILVHVATALDVCEQRDRKGLYAKARAGLLREFTGISDPYEEPQDAELLLDTSAHAAEDAADLVIAYLVREGYLTRVV